MNRPCLGQAAQCRGVEVRGGLVALLVFKTSVGLNKVPGGFDSHAPPPVRFLILIVILISAGRYVIETKQD